MFMTLLKLHVIRKRLEWDRDLERPIRDRLTPEALELLNEYSNDRKFVYISESDIMKNEAYKNFLFVTATFVKPTMLLGYQNASFTNTRLA